MLHANRGLCHLYRVKGQGDSCKPFIYVVNFRSMYKAASVYFIKTWTNKDSRNYKKTNLSPITQIDRIAVNGVIIF